MGSAIYQNIFRYRRNSAFSSSTMDEPSPQMEEVMCNMMRPGILNSLCPNHMDGFRSLHEDWGSFCLRFSQAEPSVKLFLLETFAPQPTIAKWDRLNLWVLGGHGCSTFRDLCGGWGFRALAYIRMCTRCRNFACPVPGMPHDTMVPHGCESGRFLTDDGDIAFYSGRLINLPDQAAVEQRFDEERPYTVHIPTEGVERVERSGGRRRQRQNTPVRRSPRFPRRSRFTSQ